MEYHDSGSTHDQPSKEEILAIIRQRKDEFTSEEVLNALQADTSLQTREKDEKSTETPKQSGRNRLAQRKAISVVAYSFGAVIILAGVTLLIAQFWQELGSVMRIMVTFGLGLAVYFSIVILETSNKSPYTLRAALAVVSFLLTATGTWVLMVELFDSPAVSAINLTMSILLLAMAGTLNLIRNSAVYLLFFIAFTTWALYSFLSLDSLYRTGSALMEQPESIYAYLTILIGGSYFLLARYWKEKHHWLSNVLFIFSTFFLSVPFFILGEIYQTLGWNLVGLTAVTALSRASFRLRSPSITVTGGLIMIGYIISGIGLGPGVIFNIFGVPLSLLFLVLIIIGVVKKNSYLPHLLVMILATTWFFYTALYLEFVQKLLNTYMQHPEAITMILTSLISIGYIIISYKLSEKEGRFPRFTALLYFIGGVGLVAPLMFLAEYYTGFWDVIALVALGAFIAFGTWIERKSVIITGGLLLAIYIFVISFRHFADTLGWTFALIIAGFMLIGAGYLSYHLASRTIHSDETAVE